MERSALEGFLILVCQYFPQLGALHDVLKKLQTKRLPFWEKKFGQVPTVNLTISTKLLKMERPILRKTDCLNWRVKLHFNILTFIKCFHVPCCVDDVIWCGDRWIWPHRPLHLLAKMSHTVLFCLPSFFQCDVGEQCAVRKGARIGKMCDCPRGAFCNSYLLKCLWIELVWM